MSLLFRRPPTEGHKNQETYNKDDINYESFLGGQKMPFFFSFELK
jgi:hypothetical protein